MTVLTAIGTYLPPWGGPKGRVPGPDEDAVTLGVAAGRAALDGASPTGVRAVVLVTRELPLLVGGNGAALLGGLGLPHDVPVTEQVGGAPAVADALLGAAPGTLVIGVDVPEGGLAGASAGLVGERGVAVETVGRVVRSLPVESRTPDGVSRDYADPRLSRERGLGGAVEALDLADKPLAVAGVPAKQAAALCAGAPAALPTVGASSLLFAVAALEQGGVVLATEQASATALRVESVPPVVRDEPTAQPVPRSSTTPGPEIAISLASYERAFEAKLRWEAAKCGSCGTLALPARFRCLECGAEEGWSSAALPRTGEVYTVVTVHVPVPGLPTPYSLAVVELDDVGVRALVKVTGAVAGKVGIGDRGRLVFRRVAVRTGIPDYAYALLPEPAAATTEGSA
jgi:uncharacterized OB-fold protein